jgi:hypothetical protein
VRCWYYIDSELTKMEGENARGAPLGVVCVLNRHAFALTPRQYRHYADTMRPNYTCTHIFTQFKMILSSPLIDFDALVDLHRKEPRREEANGS